MKNDDNVDSDSNDFTPVQAVQNTAIRNEKIQLTNDLIVKGNEVYLPKTHLVDCNSDEYEDEFLKLPDGMSSEISSIIKAKRTPFTVFHLIVVLLSLSASAWCVYFFFPRPIVIETMEISRQKLEKQIESKYVDVVKVAQEQIKKKDWRSAIKTLEESALVISKSKRQTQDNGLLLGLYFDAVEHCVDYQLEKPQAIIENMRKEHFDYLGWYLDWIWLSYPECRYEKAPIINPDESKAEEIKKVLQEYDENSKQWISVLDYGDNKELLDFRIAQLNYFYWCFRGPQKHEKKDDPGVSERERAYQIAKEYSDPKKEKRYDNFKQLQRDIIQTINDKVLGWGGYFYFDGDSRWAWPWWGANHINDQLKDITETNAKE